MKRLGAFAIGASLLMGTATVADTQKSETSQNGIPGDLRKERLSIIPVIGLLDYSDSAGNMTARMAGGIDLNFNLSPWFAENSLSSLYFGVNTGAIFSHLGTQGANFLGTQPNGIDTEASANFLLFPANLKLGLNIGDSNRLSIHGGGNVIYRTTTDSISIGNLAGVASSDYWAVYPNVGADYEVRFGKNVNGLLRPDVTFGPVTAIFDGVLGLSFTFE